MLNADIANIRLTYQDRELYNSVRLFEYGITPKIALPHNPAVIGIQLKRSENDKFERLIIVSTDIPRNLSVADYTKTNDEPGDKDLKESSNKESNDDDEAKNNEQEVDTTAPSTSTTSSAAVTESTEMPHSKDSVDFAESNINDEPNEEINNEYEMEQPASATNSQVEEYQQESSPDDHNSLSDN